MATGLFDDLIPQAPRNVTGAFDDLIPATTGQGLLGAAQRGVQSAQQVFPVFQLLGAQDRGPSIRQERAAFEQAMSDPRYMASLTESFDEPLRAAKVEETLGPERKLGDIRQRQEAVKQIWSGVVTDIEKEKAATPKSAAQVELSQAQTASDKWRAWLKNPVELTATIVAESLPASIAGAVLGTATAGPGIGTAAGVGLSSFATTLSSELLNEANRLGYDTSDQQSLERFVSSQDFDRAFNTATTKAAPVANIDAATAGAAGRFIAPAIKQGLGSAARATGKEVLQQAIGGSGGEFVGQTLAGQPKDWFDIAMEGVAEIFTAPGEAISNIRRTRRIGAEPQDRPVISRIERPTDATTQREVQEGVQPQRIETTTRGVPDEAGTRDIVQPTTPVQTQEEAPVLEPVFPLRKGTTTPWEDQRGRPVRLIPDPANPDRQKWTVEEAPATPPAPEQKIAPVTYRGFQEGIPGKFEGFHLYNLTETISPTLVKGSTVTEQKLNAEGFTVPESVKPVPPEQRGAALPQVQIEGNIANYPGQELLLEKVLEAINNQNASLPGLPLTKVRLSGEEGSGPAMYTMPGGGEFDTVWVNLPRIAEAIARNPRLDMTQFLKAVVNEEIVHNASGRATFDEWNRIEPVNRTPFSNFYRDKMLSIYNEMTSEQDTRTRNAYGANLSEEGVAEEFIRMLVQERMRGQITEETLGTRIIDHLKNILRKLIEAFQTTTDPNTQSLIQSHADAIQAILTEQGENPFDVMREAAGAEPPPVLTAQQQRAKEVTERARGRRPEAVGAALPESPKTPEEMDRALAVKEAEEEGWVKHRALGVDDWVLARDQWTDEEKLRSRQQAEETLTNAGIPHTWNEQNRYFDIQPGATVEAQYRLLDLVKEAMRRQNWPKEPEVAALIASITANAKLGQTDYFDSYVRRQLYKLTRSEASHRGALLGALSHFARDIREVSLRVEEILERTWADAYGGPAVEKVAEDLAKSVQEKAKDPAVAQKVLDKAPELTRAGVDAGLIGQIFQMPFFTQAELKERFIAAVVKKTRVTPAEATKLWNVFKEKFDPIRRELGRLALAEVKSLLRPDQRHLIKKPIWQKIQSMVDAGEFDAGHILKIIAGEKGWRTPTPEEISKLRQLARRERELRELNDKERAEVEKFSPNNPEALEKARLEKEKKTEQHRNQILKEMDTRWARFTRPISLNPFKWFGLRHNTASAGLELIAANLLATIGFPFRLSISIASQILPHMTLTPIAYSWQQHQGTLDTLEGQKNFIRDAYLGLEDSISAYLKSVKPAAYAARAAFLGRGEQRNVLRLTSSIAAFDRIRLMAQEEFEKGNVAKAMALKTLGFLDIGFRAARALDAFQTLPAETAEMYHQIRLEMGSQGKSLTEIKNNQYTIMDRIFREWMQAIADTKKGLADAGVTDATEAQIKEIAWTLIRQRQYQKANELKLSGDDWQRMNRLLKSTLAWNEAETKGAGGVVGGALKRIQRGVSKGLGIPTDIGVFSNAIATAINRQLHFTPFYHLLGGGRGEGSPWFATEIDRKRRALDALAGTGFGSIVIALVLMGIIKVQLPRRMDDDEKEKFIAEGHRFGTVEFQYGDTFVPVSINNSPLWIVAPYLAGAGAFMDLQERRQKEQEKLNAEAAKKGLSPGKIRPMDPGDMAGVAGQAAWQTIFGSRTFSGFLGSIASYGEKLNTRRIIAGRIAPMVPGLPAVREVVSRMGGVTLNNQLATVWDYMLPLPSSQAAMVNKLGDPVRTPSDLQRVVQVLSGGNYGPVAKQETQAYQTLYGSEFKPPTISPNKGYQFPDSFRPMNDRELSRYSILRGRYFQEGLAGIAAGDEAAVKSAYQQAERRALQEVGVEVPAPKATTARGTTTTRRTGVRGPRRLRSVSRLRRPRLKRLSYRRPRLSVRRPRLRRIRRLAA